MLSVLSWTMVCDINLVEFTSGVQLNTYGAEVPTSGVGLLAGRL